jgi:hypothetical protein
MIGYLPMYTRRPVRGAALRGILRRQYEARHDLLRSGMAERFTLEHKGRRYEVERGEARRPAATGGGAPVGSDTWYVTINLAAVTSLPAEPGETREAVEPRIRRWLDEHSEPLGGEGIYLGGG